MAASMSCRRCLFFLSNRKMKITLFKLRSVWFRRSYSSVKQLSRIAIDTNKELILEFGKLARFADGSVVAKCGDTSVLVAVTRNKEAMPNISFSPLTVDYRQKSAAAGRIPVNHLKRDLGNTDKEILTGRDIDRSLRPHFSKDYCNETQISCNLLSVDGVHDPDVIAINAASAALAVSDIPWNGPIGAVRIGCVEGSSDEFVVNPTRKEQQNSDLNLVLASDVNSNIVMMQGVANNIPYTVFNSAVTFGAECASHIARELAKLNASSKKSYGRRIEVPQDMVDDVTSIGSDRIKSIINDSSHDKVSRGKALTEARINIVKQLTDKYTDKDLLDESVNILVKKTLRDQIIHDQKRCDGRSLNSLRHIEGEVDLFSPVHGSALFQRGQTQVLSTVAFDSLHAALKIDPISVLTGAMKEKNFMLHYEFPAYATNEVKTSGGKSRRDLGHSALAENGLRAIIPNKFPFSIRLTAEVLESNGSSSMASICAGTLALMDAGVQIKHPAAGVAIGLVTDDNSTETKYHLLADIMGLEDYLGDMDMKIGGTQSGLTAIQMDLKIPSIPVQTVHDAIDMGREKITEVIHIMMDSAKITKPRETIKSNGPALEEITVLPAQRGSFLGAGGVNLKKLKNDTGVTVTPVNESTYEIFAPNQDAMDEAREMINTWLESKKEPELEFGAIYECKVTEMRSYGVMVQLHPAMDPVLVHISQLSHKKVSHTSALELEVGDLISVKYFGRDAATGQMRLSKKAITSPSARTFRFFKEDP